MLSSDATPASQESLRNAAQDAFLQHIYSSCSILIPLGSRINTPWKDSTNSKFRLVNSRPGHNHRQHRVNTESDAWEQQYCASADDANRSAVVSDKSDLTELDNVEG
jgi:hypothetical protein